MVTFQLLFSCTCHSAQCFCSHLARRMIVKHAARPKKSRISQKNICNVLKATLFANVYAILFTRVVFGRDLVPSIQYTTSSNEGQLWVPWPWPRLHIICALHSRNRLRLAQGIDGGCKWTMSHRPTPYRDALSGIRWPSVLSLRIHPAIAVAQFACHGNNVSL